jgi:hypothetical protein
MRTGGLKPMLTNPHKENLVTCTLCCNWLRLKNWISLAAVLLIGLGVAWQNAAAQSVTPPGAANKVRPAGATASSKASALDSYGKLPLSFEANSGQVNSSVKFLSRGQGYTLFLTGDEAVLSLTKPSDVGSAHAESKPSVASAPGVVRMKLVGANTDAAVTGDEELPGKTNYFIGKDPKTWRTNVPNYAKVRYQDVYPGVDLVYYGNQGGQLEYDFVVAPGTDPKAIALDVAADIAGSAKDGHRSSLRIAANGDLVVKTDGGEVRFQKPVVYQEQFATRHSLDGRYVLRGKHGIGFEVAAYDHSKPLIIDPTLIYSTFLGNQTVAAKASRWTPRATPTSRVLSVLSDRPSSP